MTSLLNNIFLEIESGDYRIIANIASSRTGFAHNVETSDAYVALSLALSQDWNLIDDIVQRVRFLCESAIDCRYEHPFDTAIATYLIFLANKEPRTLPDLYKTVQGCRNLFWANPGFIVGAYE